MPAASLICVSIGFWRAGDTPLCRHILLVSCSSIARSLGCLHTSVTVNSAAADMRCCLFEILTLTLLFIYGPVSVSVCHLCTGTQRPEEGQGSLGAEVTGIERLPNLSPPEGQQELLSAEPSPQPRDTDLTATQGWVFWDIWWFYWLFIQCYPALT